MSPGSLRALIAGGETFTVEFKGEARSRVSDTDLIETVTCLANGEGGTALVGVDDNGRVTGAQPRHEAGTTNLDRVVAVVANRTQPPLRVGAELVRIDGKDVLVLSVPNAPSPVGTSDGRYVRRAMGGDGRPACVPFHAVEMLAGQIDRGAVDYAAIEVREATWADLDPLEFERFRSLVRRSAPRSDQALAGLSDLDIARALGVVGGTPAAPVVRAGALLLFGRSEALARHVPTHEIAFQALSGTSVIANDITRVPLLQGAEELFERFRARNQEEEVAIGLLRMAVPAYPEESYREAVANSLVHRDFTRQGAVHVQWMADRIAISNPGGLPPGVSVDTLLSAPPRPRNPLLADAFKRAGLVERTGRGVNRIFEGQARFGRALPDYGRTTRDDVVVEIPGGPANLEVARFVQEQADRGQPLSLPMLLVLNHLLVERRATTADLASLVQATEPDVRALLGNMVELGYVEPRGERKGRTWHLSAGAYRSLDQRAGYVRTRGFEPLQQEQMVLSYVEAHGSIARSQAAELCQLSPAQATRLLRHLVEASELQRQGERRASRYVRVV